VAYFLGFFKEVNLFICVVHYHEHASDALLLLYVGADLRLTSPQPGTSLTLRDHRCVLVLGVRIVGFFCTAI